MSALRISELTSWSMLVFSPICDRLTCEGENSSQYVEFTKETSENWV
jgi:hypothetical protein